jgi:hypothetical protein
MIVQVPRICALWGPTIPGARTSSHIPGAGNISQKPLTAYPEDRWAHIFKLEDVSNQPVMVWWAQDKTWLSSVQQQRP